MKPEAVFNVQHNNAFHHERVIRPGTNWSAFDVSKEAAKRGDAKRFAMAIWNMYGNPADPEGSRPSILRDRMSGTHWYRFPREGDSQNHRKNVWTSLQIAQKMRLEMVGILKEANSADALCSLEHVFDIEEIVFDAGDTAAWVRLSAQRESDFGCEVGEVDLPHVIARSVLVDEKLIARADRPITDLNGGVEKKGEVSRRQYEAACRIAEQVFLNLRTRAEGLSVLTSEFQMNSDSADHLRRIYAHLLEGRVFNTHASADAIRHFVEEILTSFGGGARANMAASLAGYVAYVRTRSPFGGGELQGVLEGLQAGTARGRIGANDLPKRLAAEVSDLPATQASEILKEVWVRGPEHGRFKRALLKRWNSRCSVHGDPCNDQLRASHIVAWSLDETRRADVNNGLLLSAPLDNLFDSGLITFSDSGCVVYSQKLQPETQRHFGLNSKLKVAWEHLLSEDRSEIRKNLARHRALHARIHDYTP